MSAEAAHTRSETPDRGDLAALGVCALIWGSTWLVLKFQLGTVDPILSILLRFLVSGLLIFPRLFVGAATNASHTHKQQMKRTRKQNDVCARSGADALGGKKEAKQTKEGGRNLGP